MHRTARFAVAAVLVLVLVGAASACSSDSASVSSTGSEPGTTATTRPIGGSMMTTVPPDEVVTAEMLVDQTFVSTEVTGHELAPGTTITMSFTETDLSANAGCNSIGGAYTLAGGVLTVTGDVRTTMMACPEPLSSQDSWLTNWLQSGLTIAATPDGFSLTGDDVTIAFAQQLDAGGGGESGATGLVGPTWTVHSYTTGDAVTSYAWPAPTFTFADDGTVAVFTGCNSGSTTYTATDDTITFAPMAMTLMGCPADDGGNAEMAISILMGSPVTYSFEAGDLVLTMFEGGVIASPA